MTSPIYSATPQEKLRDLIKAAQLALDLMEHSHKLMRPTEPNEAKKFRPGEFAIGNWIVRPRFN